jgi:hypothetical protein
VEDGLGAAAAKAERRKDSMKMMIHGSPATSSHAGTDTGLEQILGRLQSMAQDIHRTYVVGVAGCAAGDGATFIVDTLARELTSRSRKRVLQADCTDLLAGTVLSASELMAHCFYTEQPGRWRLSTPKATRGPRALIPNGNPRDPIRVFDAHFDFLLLDCGAITSSGWLWQASPLLDDLFLVVAADETRRDQVRYAQQVIAQAGARLSGCILNKRRYPLPAFVHRMLA